MTHATPHHLFASTHEVINVSRELENYNLFRDDAAFQEAVAREGAGWATETLTAFGKLTGSAEMLEQGSLANHHHPELDTHDRFGNRVDLVRYHPAYHLFMRTSIEHGLHSAPWTDPKPGAHVARASHSYMMGQIEAGHGCPITMTFASVPSLRTTPTLVQKWESKITARVYDPRNIPAEQKAGLTVGMGMTEKQGGSDVRANSTKAFPLAGGGPGEAYELVGHKFFLSAPMCDMFLTLAQTSAGLSCFLVPRWRPDGTKNPLEIIRLKRKMANQSNASSEVELRGALGWMVGEEGRGVRTIIEMVAMTRFDCMVGSSALLRIAASQALFHCSHRRAFGKWLIDQPLMQNVLADLTLEAEAALTLSLRMARALDHRSDPQEDLLVRLGTAVGKYWICKRAPAFTYEAMECIGGSGVMEDCMMPRIYREAPINAIWEGSGNVQCLDVLRVMQKTPDAVAAFFAEVGKAQGGNRLLDTHITELQREISDLEEIEFRARDLVDRMALALQGALLVQHAPAAVSEAFCASRLGSSGHHQIGVLPRGTDCAALFRRAMPQVG